jgi:hypothetical protein
MCKGRAVAWLAPAFLVILCGVAQAQIVMPARYLATFPDAAQPQPGDPPVPPVDAPRQMDPLPAPADTSVESDVPPSAPTPFDWSKFRLGGQYRIEPNASDFEFHPTSISNNQPNQEFVSQRFRLWLTYTPTEHVEGYLQMQIGGINWGTDYDFSKNFPANYSPVEGDRIGIELRRAWLAYKDSDWGKVRVGFLDWHDEFDDTMASSDYDFNIAGIDWENTFKDCNNLHARAAMLLLDDQAFATTDPTDEPGSHTAILYAVDVDQPLGSKSSIGGSIYYLNDGGDYSYPTIGPYSSSWDLWIGLRGKYAEGPAPVTGFVLMDTGGLHTFGPTYHHTGWAGQVELGPIPLGPGKFSTQLVVSSGSSDGSFGESQFRTLAQTNRDNFGAEGYWSYMHITSANGPSDVNDLGVSLQNQGYGLFTPQARYELPLCKKLLSTSSIGWFRTTATNPNSGGSVIGTELAQMFSYDFGGGLTLDVGAAVLFTGDYYRASQTAPDPQNIYEGFARLQLEF